MNLISLLCMINTLGSVYNEKFWKSNLHGDGSQPQSRILNGVELSIVEHEFMVAVVSTHKRILKLHCSATIISKKFALSAASCVEGKDKFLRGNTTDWVTETNSIDHLIEKTYIHPNYDNKKQQNNIALIAVKDRHLFEGLREKIVRFIDRNVVDNRIHYPEAYGWGLVDLFGGPNSYIHPHHLRGIGVDGVISATECTEKLPNGIEIDKEKQLCVEENLVGPCHGDEGGPLMHTGMLLGILSRGGCGKTPSVYSKIYYYSEWIFSITDDQRHRRPSKKKYPHNGKM